jgi:hypothetical protein
VHDEGKFRSHQLVVGVGLAHLPTLVLLMVGEKWTLRDWTEGPSIPLRVRPQLCHTSPPTWLLVSGIFLVRRHSQL